MAADSRPSIHPSGNWPARPPDSYAEAAKRSLNGNPGGSSAPGKCGPTSTPPQVDPFAVPRAAAEGVFRIYTRGTFLSKDDVADAVEDQLGVEIGSYRACGPSHVDVEIPNEEDRKKLAGAKITVGGKKYRIGPTFFFREKVAVVILTNVGDCSTKRAEEAFRAALGQGATYLTKTRGSSMEEARPDFRDKIYLQVDPEVRMRDVVPRRLIINGVYHYAHWHNAVS